MYGDGTLFRKKRSPYWYMSYWLRGEQRHESTKETDYAKARQRLKKRLREIGADLIGAKKFVGPQSQKLTSETFSIHSQKISRFARNSQTRHNRK
jgi:hypothetical protein